MINQTLALVEMARHHDAVIQRRTYDLSGFGNHFTIGGEEWNDIVAAYEGGDNGRMSRLERLEHALSYVAQDLCHAAGAYEYRLKPK